MVWLRLLKIQVKHLLIWEENIKKGIKLIKDEFNLMPLSNFTYKEYKTYGWQVTKGSKKAQEEARFVSSFLDIYENSFN